MSIHVHECGLSHCCLSFISPDSSMCCTLNFHVYELCCVRCHVSTASGSVHAVLTKTLLYKQALTIWLLCLTQDAYRRHGFWLCVVFRLLMLNMFKTPCSLLIQQRDSGGLRHSYSTGINVFTPTFVAIGAELLGVFALFFEVLKTIISSAELGCVNGYVCACLSASLLCCQITT